MRSIYCTLLDYGKGKTLNMISKRKFSQTYFFTFKDKEKIIAFFFAVGMYLCHFVLSLYIGT